MDISRLDPNAVPGASSSLAALSSGSERASGQSFAALLKTEAQQAESGRSGALASLLNRSVAAVAPATETGALSVQAVAPAEGTVADAASALREWGGASRSKKAKNGQSPLALSANDASLAGRYDVLARRDDNESRGVRHSQRA